LPRFLNISEPTRLATLDTIVEKFAQPLLPELNCKHCGFENCNEFMKEVLKGNKHYQDCFVMNAENLELMLKVNGNIIPCNPFVQSVLKNVILGVIKSIKLEDKEISEMEITVKLDEKSREVIE
ncbi:MAG: (Fe-S)-binding protein, partial [Candidatus Thorarchaeota archaeon]